MFVALWRPVGKSSHYIIVYYYYAVVSGYSPSLCPAAKGHGMEIFDSEGGKRVCNAVMYSYSGHGLYCREQRDYIV